jgi:hypothetical protein
VLSNFVKKLGLLISLENKTLTRPDPSLCEINEITLVDQQSQETLAGESSFTSVSDNGCFISSADEHVLANWASLATPSEGLHLSLTYINHSALPINECSLRRRTYQETKAKMVLIQHLITSGKLLRQKFIVVRRIYNC